MSLLLLLAMFAAPSCLEVPIEHNDSGPHVAAQPYWIGEDRGAEVRYALVGHFVWFQWGHADNPGANEDGIYEDTLSFDVQDPNVYAVRGCVDGSVDIFKTEPEPASEPEPDSEAMASWCDAYGDTLRVFCGLPDRVITVYSLFLE